KDIPVIILSANTVEQTAKTVFAISQGAVDFIKKLNDDKQKNNQSYQQDVLAKIMQANNITSRSLFNKDQTRMTNEINRQNEKENTNIRNVQSEKRTSLIAIGTSTGGP